MENNEEIILTEDQKKAIVEQYITIDNVEESKKQKVLNDFFYILKCCKEISNTMFPIPGTDINNLTLVEIRIHCKSKPEDKEQRYEFSGSFGLMNEPNDEYRWVNGDMVIKKDYAKVSLEITRLGDKIPPEDKIIYTNDYIRPTKEGISVVNETLIRFKGTTKNKYVIPYSTETNEYDKEAVRLIRLHKN